MSAKRPTTKKNPTPPTREQHLAQAEEAVRQRLDLETLETRNSDSLDFHDVSVASIRAAVRIAFDAGFAAAGGTVEIIPTEPDEMLATLKITKTTRRHAGAGTWVSGTIAGHAFEALVFPEHAETASYELGDSRISKLHLREIATGTEVACFDRGWDMQPTTDAARAVAHLLAAGLAETVYGK
jgi:hypothetical protein